MNMLFLDTAAGFPFVHLYSIPICEYTLICVMIFYYIVLSVIIFLLAATLL